MNVSPAFDKTNVEKRIKNTFELLVLRVEMSKKTILMVVILSYTFSYAVFSQEIPVFLSKYDSCHITALPPITDSYDIKVGSLGAPLVRVAYVIPSNRTAQPNAVAYLQNAIKIGQQWFKEQMEQNGMGAKSYIFETEEDAVTPLIHVVHVEETDDFLRNDLWGNTLQAASKAGVTVWSRGEVWVLVPETHLMLSDRTVIGGVALGGSYGTGDTGGVAVLGSDGLPFYQPEIMVDNTSYDGKILPALGPFPMKQDISAPWFEGSTFSSVASSRLGALFHEMGHAFGLGHDYRNDANFHGNLMFNGLRGIRGNLFPQQYPQDYTRLAYASALILNVNHYFNRSKKVTPSPVISFSSTGSVVPEQGHVRIEFQTSDDDSLRLAHLRFQGNVVAEMILDGISTETGFNIPYFTKGGNNSYTIAVHDKQGNTSYRDVQFYVPDGYNQAPIPFIRLDPPILSMNQPIALQASFSQDIDHPLSLVMAEWDIDNDGQFDTEASTNKTAQYYYESPGNYLITLRLTDPEGAQTVSTPVSIKIPGEQKIAIESFTLINADKDEEVTGLQDGDIIDLKAWKDMEFNIQANTFPEKVDQVQFELTGPVTHKQVEKIPPYALFGDNPTGDFHGRELIEGRYTLTATPFFEEKKGNAHTVSFQVSEDVVIDYPTIEWDKTIGGSGSDDVFSIIPIPDGGYLLAGSSTSNASGDKSENRKGGDDYWVVEIDDYGNKQWDKTLGGSIEDELSSVIPTPDGGYLLAGSSNSPASGDKSENPNGKYDYYDYWVVKIDDQGNKQWDKTLGGSNGNTLSSAILTSDGGYLLAGFSSSDASGDKSENSVGEVDYWVIKIDDQGNKRWDKTLGGSRGDQLISAISASDGGYLLAGFSSSNASGDKSENSKGGYDYWIVKIDDQGNKQWDKTLGGNSGDMLRSAISTPDGGYLLSGSSNSAASGDKSENSKGDYDYWIVKINDQGDKVWDKTIGGSNGEYLSTAIPASYEGYLLLGSSISNASGDKSEDSKGDRDYWVVKINDQGDKIWDKTLGGSEYDLLRCAASTIDGGYLLGGVSNSPASGNKSENSKGQFDYWIVKLQDNTTPVVTSFTLVDAATDQEIKELKEGDVINLSEVGGEWLNIRANVSAGKTDRVKLELQGPIKHRQTEEVFPYALFGDNPPGDYHEGKLLEGEYILTATPYLGFIPGISHTINFTVIDNEFIHVSKSLKVAVYPVPTSDIINILHEGEVDQADLMLLDFKGKVLLYQPLSTQPVEQVDMNGFQKGVYYLKVVSAEGVQIIRVAKE